MTNYVAIVIGGGVIGSAVAYGLTRRKPIVLVLDGDNEAPRASHANFGLVWVQGKGLGRPEYAECCRPPPAANDDPGRLSEWAR